MFKASSTNLRHMVFAFLSDDDLAISLLKSLEEHYELILFGGVVRDYVVSSSIAPRDIDIVLVGANKYLLEIERNAYFKDRIRRNSFGGFKIFCESSVFDIWNINDTWAFKEKLVEPSIENLLRTVYLNIDAYAYSLTKQVFIDNCNSRKLPATIDIVLQQNPNLLLNFIRAFALSRKYQIEFSDNFKRAIIREIHNANSSGSFISALIKEQERHLNETAVTLSEISELVTEIQELELELMSKC